MGADAVVALLPSDALQGGDGAAVAADGADGAGGLVQRLQRAQHVAIHRAVQGVRRRSIRPALQFR